VAGHTLIQVRIPVLQEEPQVVRVVVLVLLLDRVLQVVQVLGRWVLGRWVLGRWVLGRWVLGRWVLGRWVVLAQWVGQG
jgi:hypothetical protein